MATKDDDADDGLPLKPRKPSAVGLSDAATMTKGRIRGDLTAQQKKAAGQAQPRRTNVVGARG